MSDLLQVMSLARKRGSTPLAVEFQVNSELHPYLVTAAGRSKFIWLPQSRGGMIRAAFRKTGREDLYLDIVREIQISAEEHGWGNVFPMSNTGLAEAVERLEYYDFDEVDLLVPTGGISTSIPSDIEQVESSWVPVGMAVLVPRNRGCLGFVADMEDGNYLSVVHNPSRSICVVIDESL